MRNKRILTLLLLLNFFSFSTFGTIDLDGDGYVNCGDISALDGATELTLACWVKFDAISGSMIRKWTASNQSFILGTFGADEFAMTINDDGQDDILTVASTDANLATGVWYHLTGVWSGSNNVALYKDGDAVGTTIVTDNNPTEVDANGENLAIGARYNLGSPDSFVTGEFSDVLLITKALTASEVKLIAKSKMKHMSFWVFKDQTGENGKFYPLDDLPEGTSINGQTLQDWQGGLEGTGVDGTGGSVGKAEAVLSYDFSPIIVTRDAGVAPTGAPQVIIISKLEQFIINLINVAVAII